MLETLQNIHPALQLLLFLQGGAFLLAISTFLGEVAEGAGTARERVKSGLFGGMMTSLSLIILPPFILWGSYKFLQRLWRNE